MTEVAGGKTLARRRLVFRILGPLEVEGEGGPLALVGRKQRALLALLLLHPGEVVSSDRLVDALWGEAPPATAATSLRNLVAQLRKLLGAETIVTRPSGYLLAIEPETLDFARFERLLAQARKAQPREKPILLREALALWRGPPLADLAFERFAQGEVHRLEELRTETLEQRLEAELALGQGAELVAELETLVQQHPLRERFRAQLMLALYRGGRQSEALEAYQSLRRTLVEELGVEPSPELQELHGAILRQEPTLAPSRTREPIKTNLPIEPTPLVGRKQELAEIRELVQMNRLVTLTGAGGSGKTRLALRAAHALLEEFEDGVWFVRLAPLTDPALVETTVAQALGVRGELGEFLRGKQLLLLLDNLEQLLPEVAPIVARLETKVLATSRERLNVATEQEYPVATLPLSDAVQLFTQRARQLEPRFEPDDHVPEVARRVDGLPLALELAAARVKALTPKQIVERLGERLELLTGGARDTPERQRTLRATIDWSYRLLDPQEQELFARLAVFAGGCTLEAAEQVTDAQLDVLQSLVDKNLLLHRGDRYSMLETIREYALERLEKLGEHDRVSRALAEYLVTLAEESPAFRGYTTRSQTARLLGDELDNLRTALAWALAAPEPELALRLASEVMWFSRGGNLLPEQLRWLDEALRNASSVSPRAHARAFQQAAVCARGLGDFERAHVLGEQALCLFQELGDDLSRIDVLRDLGDAASGTGDYTHARAWYEAAYELSERLTDEHRVRTIHALGKFELASGGDLRRAAELFERSMTLARVTDDRWWMSHILHGSGDVALAQGDHARALSFYRDALRHSHQMSDWRTAVYCIAALAAVAALAGDTSRAGQLSGACEKLESELGWQVLENEGKTYDAAVAICSDTDPIVFATAADRGRQMSVEEIVDYVLREGD